MRILIIRHGDPDYARDSLTEKGFRERACLLETLKKEGITSIYVSPLGRAQRTAEPIAEYCGIEPITLDWLREFPGSVKPPYEELGIVPAWNTNCPWNLMPQYWTTQNEFYSNEMWADHPLYDGSGVHKTCAAIDAGWEALMDRHGYERNGQLYDIKPDTDESQTIALFCHLGLGLGLLSRILKAPLPFMWQSFFLPCSSVTTVYTEKYKPYLNQCILRVIGLGDVSHLRMGDESVSSSGLHSQILLPPDGDPAFGH